LHVELADAMSDFEIAVKMLDNKPMPVLVDSRAFSYFTDEVRAFYASKDRVKNISAMAVLINSLPTRLMGNFFIKINKPHFSTKLFTDEAEAVKWINKIISENKKNFAGNG
jgi:hypothetical protein